MNSKLATSFLDHSLKSPLVLPAGVMDISASAMAICAKNGAGVLTSKSLTLEPREGHQGPVVCETEGGLLNCMGLCNPGIDAGLQEIDRFKDEYDNPVIVSLFATCEDEFCSLTEKVNSSEADFIELNLSCPNVYDEFGLPLSSSKEKVYAIVKAVKQMAAKPVIAKLSPNVLSITDIAIAAQNAGADALCMINTLGPGMRIDIRMQKTILSNRFGGLSGACVLPIALKLIYETYSKVEIPIIGMGGVSCGSDAVEMMIAGAALVGVGTAVYTDGLQVFDKINCEIVDWMTELSLDKLDKIPRLEKLDG
jgi:dihydroorotate dehydrogenase (NAD+) catalytic subunit